MCHQNNNFKINKQSIDLLTYLFFPLHKEFLLNSLGNVKAFNDKKSFGCQGTKVECRLKKIEIQIYSSWFIFLCSYTRKNQSSINTAQQSFDGFFSLSNKAQFFKRHTFDSSKN